VWLQAQALRGAADAAAPANESLEEAGDAPDMPRLQLLAQRGVDRVVALLGAAPARERMHTCSLR
jgi:hypothetical protein